MGESSRGFLFVLTRFLVLLDTTFYPCNFFAIFFVGTKLSCSCIHLWIGNNFPVAFSKVSSSAAPCRKEIFLWKILFLLLR